MATSQLLVHIGILHIKLSLLCQRHQEFYSPFIGILLRVSAAAKSLQACPTLCDPMGCSTPGSSVHGIFQARVLEWGAIAFSGIQCYQNLNQWQRRVLNVLIWFFSSIYLVLFMLFLFLLIQVGGQDVIYKVSKVNYCQLLDNCLFNFKP